jgi:hypothetical protein
MRTWKPAWARGRARGRSFMIADLSGVIEAEKWIGKNKQER